GMEWLSLTNGDGVSITAIVYPSRGSLDMRPMQRRAARNGNQTIATGLIAGGDISWISEETNGWPIHASWDNVRYRIELSIGNVTSRDDWNEDDLVALIYALAGEAPE
ncbi:MAG TPA: hypothetical protein VFV93_05975, partial [Thermomicrobiales bacterium]|nr:hypothetical protein [Thermomicrobiales bacterium]